MKKAMVFGLGVSGLGAQKILNKLSYEVIAVDDKKGISSEDAIKQLDNIDVFIKSPGIEYTNLVKEAIKKGIKVIDEIELAYNYMKKVSPNTKVIAVTGTNGKSTTTTKISELLSFGGYNSKYAGNIGISFSEVLLNNENLDYVVLELSSFQLENLENFKADIAMVVNLSPDHIKRYASIEEYYDVKVGISRNQTENDIFILNADDKEILNREAKINAKIMKVSQKSKTDTYFDNGKIYYQGEEVLETEKLSLKGRHNIENALFIVTVAKVSNIENEKIREFLYNTKSLEHRMENFFNYGGLKFINDSKGTNIDSTRFALEAFKDCILICGGYDKQVDWQPLINLIKENAKEVYLIGDLSNKFNDMLKAVNYDTKNIHTLETIEASLKDMKSRFTEEDDELVLLSPATSSYDQFSSFEDRGRQFKKLTLEIFGR